MAQNRARNSNRVRLRPHDTFDLIRPLARSRSDPRKAVAELAQNSLDAGARRIELTWFNKKRQRALGIWDDGAGVFPELERGEVLRRIAHTIGYSHKRDLSPIERKEQGVLGRYGIGLIGFWSVGRVLEMKSRVGGDKAWLLTMYEDKARATVGEARSRRIVDAETYTRVTIIGIHEAAIDKIRPARLQAYLANELRGQLLEREAIVRIVDRVARGRVRKLFVVGPRPYLGRSLDPRSHGLLEGVIDFPELHVAPGSRRGFAHDEPVAAFPAAIEGLERELVDSIEEEQRRRTALRQENLARDIRKAFRSVASHLPDYDFFAVRGREAGADGKGGGEGAVLRTPPRPLRARYSSPGSSPTLPKSGPSPSSPPKAKRRPAGAFSLSVPSWVWRSTRYAISAARGMETCWSGCSRC
jgi:hypothetical protein